MLGLRNTVPVLRYANFLLEDDKKSILHRLTISKGFAEFFTEILFSASHVQNAARPFAQILEHLSADTDPTPMLIHCHLGKDRTGVISALILSLCGVSDEVVAREYHLTDVELASHHAELVNAHLQNPTFKGTREDAAILVQSR